MSGNYMAAAPNPSLSDRASEFFTVPAGVTSLTVVVTGGTGAVGGAASAQGGAGREVTAIVPVTPGEKLTLITGQGGINANTQAIDSPDRFTLRQGGGGYGPGGSTQAVNTNYGTDTSTRFAQSGGSGGGGSAILRGTVPLIVAGGGGGGGRTAISASEAANWSTPSVPGSAGDAGGLVSTRSRTNPSVTVRVTAGGAGTTSGPGAGGAAGTITGATVLDSKPGLAGAAHLAGGGGANGVAENYPYLAPTSTDVGVNSAGGTSGGGGGGYAGGGSGGVIAAGNTVQARVLAAGGGGGGASYVDPAVTLVSSVVSNRPGTTYGTRVPGQITLSWTC
ncbi:hypothetical protein [Microbacterium sp. NPDC056052]|uniref:hypothetical protein n=1 Tax=Microbacterium sp. NPDC056052 TaxID=3345695 RepID=UPI0035DE1421